MLEQLDKFDQLGALSWEAQLLLAFAAYGATHFVLTVAAWLFRGFTWLVLKIVLYFAGFVMRRHHRRRRAAFDAEAIRLNDGSFIFRGTRFYPPRERHSTGRQQGKT